MNNDVISRVAALPSLDSTMLKQLWQELFNETAPRQKRDYLIPRLAWRIQELAYGGLKPKTQTEIDRLVRSNKPITAQSLKNSSRLNIAVGTQLIRDYKGVEYHVTATRNGFELDGKTYKSLSEVARVITGTRWSGPVFFGLSMGKS